MKKGAGLLLIIFFSSLVLLSFTAAISCTSSSNCTTNQTCINGTCTNPSTTTSTITMQQNLSKIDSGFKCLENKTRGKCSTLSVQELSLILLATPASDVLTECKSALLAKKSTNCFPSGNCNIKDTAMAILALNHVGENTDVYETWLLSKNITPNDLVWYLEQDSTQASQCTISYNSNDYQITVQDNKKFSSSAGPCLSSAQSDFWLQLASNCQNTEFSVSCDQNFISTLLYRQSGASTIFVSSDTKSAAAFGTVNLKVNAKCFSTSSSCDYEGSLWAAYALLKTGYNIEAFVPYLLAMADTNKRYLPESFNYLVTGYQDYATQLIANQRVGNYWEADSTAYNRYYDTSLALVALGTTNSQQVIKSKDWLLFSQSSDGCWQTNSKIRDTAAILWALAQRASSPAISGGVTYCEQASAFCIPLADCPTDQRLGNNFVCTSGSTTTCCRTNTLKTCTEYQGRVCPSNLVCSGVPRTSSDTTSTGCCIGECVNQTTPSQDMCEDQGTDYNCREECKTGEQSTNLYSCSTGQCCKASTTTSSGSSWWIWILILAILIVLAIIIFLFRDRLRLMFFKLKKDKGSASSSSSSSGFPPRPGFPPVRPMPQRMPVRPMPPRQVQQTARPQQTQSRPTTKDKMDDTFKRLKDMSK